MEPILPVYRQEENEGGQDLPSLFSFSTWKKGVTGRKMRSIELTLIFGIGITFGVILKEAAIRSITIGYQDYTLQERENKIDFNEVERSILAKGNSPFETENSGNAGICSQ